MENEARQKLKTLIKERGKNFHENSRCAAILEEYCVPHKREANLLIYALKEDIPKNLLVSKNNPLIGEIVDQLVQRLVQNYGTSNEMAQWAVKSWAEALEIDIGIAQPPPEPPKIFQKQPKIILISVVSACFFLVGLISGAGINSYHNLQSLKDTLEQAKLNQSRREYWKCVIDPERIGFNAPDNLYGQAQEIQHKCALEHSKELASGGYISSAIINAKIANTEESSILLHDYFLGKKIVVENKCPYSIDILVNFIIPNNDFKPYTGLWKFSANEKVSLSTSDNISDNTPAKIIDPIYYLYKQTNAPETDWRGVNQENSLHDKEIIYDYKNYKSKKFRMKKLIFPESGRFENDTFIISPCN